MVGDGAVARSNPVTVRASSSPSTVSSNIADRWRDGEQPSDRRDILGHRERLYAGGNVTRYINPPVNSSSAIAPLTADQSGNLTWAFTPTCANFDPRNTVAIYAVDDATGRISNTITETVTGSVLALLSFRRLLRRAGVKGNQHGSDVDRVAVGELDGRGRRARRRGMCRSCCRSLRASRVPVSQPAGHAAAKRSSHRV